MERTRRQDGPDHGRRQRDRFATAQRALEEGARVAVADIDAAAVERVAAETRGVHFVRLDVTSDASWKPRWTTCANVERSTAWSTSAGIFLVGDVESISLEDWHRTQAIDVDGVFLGCRRAVRAMKKTRRLDRQHVVRQRAGRRR